MSPAHKKPSELPSHWEHFEHGADIGVRGFGLTLADAFDQCARGLMAAMTDLTSIGTGQSVEVSCSAPDDESLLVAWLNELIYEMSVQHLIFGRFDVAIIDHTLSAKAWGEPVERLRHAAAVEPKGATFTALKVEHGADGLWLAQCVVDV